MTKPKVPKVPRGRPPARGEAGSTMTIRLTQAERTAYKRLAELAGVSLAGWIRNCCEKERRRVERQQ